MFMTTQDIIILCVYSTSSGVRLLILHHLHSRINQSIPYVNLLSRYNQKKKGGGMSDQCKHCECRGDYERCNNTPCFHHENWINLRRIREIKFLRRRINGAMRLLHQNIDSKEVWRYLNGSTCECANMPKGISCVFCMEAKYHSEKEEVV